ncbi:MAG: metal ABC transporter ATP-binding protein [Salinispira sp.]
MNVTNTLRYGGKCNFSVKPGAAALDISGLSFAYPRDTECVLQDLNIRVEPGERVALAGPNGAGKSTLLKIIMGELSSRNGNILIYGHPVQRCHHRVAVIPQRSKIDWNFPLNVRQIVNMGRYPHLGWLHHLQKKDEEIVDTAMETMEIRDLAGRQIGELSGGQQQRVMLARMLAQDSDLFLLDEPLNHVDIRSQELIFHTLEDLSRKGKTSIVSTHDLGILTVHFNRALFLDKKIIADGPVKTVMTPETIARAYGFEFHKDYHRV